MNNEFEILPWMEKHFDERQIKEIKFNSLYATEFFHGTDGHNVRLLVAKLAGLLSELHCELLGELYPDTIDPIMGYDLKIKEE